MKKLLPLLLVGLLPLPLQGETAIWSNGWSGGDGPAGIPDANDDVLLLSGNLTWDTALPKTVGSWNQHAAYGDTVTFHTTHPDYDTAFTNLHIFGDCIVSNGTWQHRGDQPSTEQQQRYWLSARIGGDFVLGSNATISVDEQGFNNAGPGQGGGQGGASHGGAGEVSKVCYGDYDHPTTYGSSSGGHRGGGAINLDVDGSASVNGTMSANGKGSGDRSAAGGSVFLRANSIGGSGSITADGGSSSLESGGGRVAVVLTGAGNDFSGFTGTMQALGPGASRINSCCGTVYQQTGDGRRIMIVDNGGKTSEADRTTKIPQPGLGENSWVLDEINVRDGGVLDVTENATLTLNSNSLTNDGTVIGYIRLSGSQLNVPAVLTLRNLTGLIVDGAHTITSDVTVASGGRITHSKNPLNDTAETYKMDLTIVGDLTVEPGGEINVDARGFAGAGPGPGNSQGGSAYGGRGTASANTYGSILAPNNLGSSGSSSYPGGGSAKVNVTGAMSVDGVISADGWSAGDRCGAGGSVFLSTGSLSGNGGIQADGGNAGNACGGGRVAVVVTNASADFSGFTGTIDAIPLRAHALSAPGSVYKCWDANKEVHIQNLDRTSAATEVRPQFAGNATYPAENFAPEENYGTVTFFAYDEGRIAVREPQALGGIVLTNNIDNGYLDFTTVNTQFVGRLNVNGFEFPPGAEYSVSEINTTSGVSWVTGDGAVFVGLFIENDDPTGISLVSAEFNGELFTLGGGHPLVELYYGCTDGETNKTDWDASASFGTIAEAMALATNLNVSSNLVYFYAYYASNNTHDAWAAPPASFLAGEVWLENTDTNASEITLDPGTVTVRRPATATNGPVTVNYSVGGTADNGVDYEWLSGTVTIPEDADSAPIVVQPIRTDNLAPETVVVTIKSGLYLVGAPSVATVHIENTGLTGIYNTWIGANSLDSNSWSLGRIPVSNDTIFLTVHSDESLAWGPNLPHSVNAWTQTVHYSGTVTVHTTYPTFDTAFTNFHVVSNLVIEGGTWAQVKNPTGTEQRYRLQVSVGGDFCLGEDAQINLYKLGFTSGGPGLGDTYGCASYGGRGSDLDKTYGSVVRPELLGSGAGGYAGGGSLRLEANGDARVDGNISAAGFSEGDRSAAGGGVWLTASTLSGGGSISATGGSAGHPSGGGRVAVVLMGLLADFSAFEGTGGSISAHGANRAGNHSSGTVYREAPGGARLLFIDNGNRLNSGFTSFPPLFTGDVTYAASVFAFNDDLVDTTLVLTNGGNLFLSGDVHVGGFVIGSPGEMVDLGVGGSTLLTHLFIEGGVLRDQGIYTTNDWNGLPTPPNVTGSGKIEVEGRAEGMQLLFK